MMKKLLPFRLKTTESDYDETVSLALAVTFAIFAVTVTLCLPAF